MDDSMMDWHPTTPPRPFDPYGDGYIPGGWPADPPTPTAGIFARRPDPGFFLPAAKKVCRGVVKTLHFLTVKPARATIREVQSRNREARIAAYRARPLPHLAESPFRRAQRYRREGPGPIQSYDTVRTTPNPFRSIAESPLAAQPDPATTYNWAEVDFAGTPSRLPRNGELSNIQTPTRVPSSLSEIDCAESTTTPPYHGESSKTQTPTRVPSSLRKANFAGSPRRPSYNGESSNTHTFNRPPASSPPSPETPDTPQTMSTQSSRSTPRSYSKLKLYRDDGRFPNIRPSGIKMRSRRRKRLLTPPDSPSTQLMTDLYKHTTNSDNEDTKTNVSSDFDDAWVPIEMGRLKKGKAIVPKRKTYGSPINSPPKPASAATEPSSPPTSATETAESSSDTKPQSDKELDKPKPHSEIDPDEHQPQLTYDHVEQTPSKPPRNITLSEQPTPNSGSPAAPTTPQSRSPYFPRTPESDISSTVPWSPSHDDPTMYLEDILTPSKPTTPTTPAVAASSPLTPLGKSPSPPANFHELDINSRPVTPEEEVITPKKQVVTPVKQVIASPKAEHHSGQRTVRKTRAQEQKEKWEQTNNEYEKLAPLDTAWEEKVKQAVQHGHGKLTQRDLVRVVPGRTTHSTDNWLNDEVVNEYLALVVAHGKQHDRVGQVPSHFAFNNNFYNKLVEPTGPEGVKRWGSRAKIGGKALLQTKKVFIPICHGMHWTLAVVSGEEKTIRYYNSMRGSGQQKLNAVKGWVKNELGSAFKEDEWTLEQGESPMQANMDDCGVFTITSARQIMLGFTPMSYGPEDIEVQRKRIVAELVNGALLKAKKKKDDE